MHRLLCIVGLVACGGGEPNIHGDVELGVEVDLREFRVLELRGYASYDDGPPSLDPAYQRSIPLADVQFPYFYRMFERRPSGYQVHLHAWLGRELGEIAPSEGAPYGKAFAELCECSTEGAAYADATITLDALAK